MCKLGRKKERATPGRSACAIKEVATVCGIALQSLKEWLNTKRGLGGVTPHERSRARTLAGPTTVTIHDITK